MKCKTKSCNNLAFKPRRGPSSIYCLKCKKKRRQDQMHKHYVRLRSADIRAEIYRDTLEQIVMVAKRKPPERPEYFGVLAQATLETDV